MILGLLILCSTGCALAVPAYTRTDPVPFDFELSALVPGVSTRNAMIALLGEPPIVRQNGAVVVYGQSAVTKGFYLWGAEDPHTDLFYLVVELDKHDIVRRAEVVSKDGTPCTSWGLCIDYAKWISASQSPTHPVKTLADGDQNVVVLVPADQNVALQATEDKQGHCKVFIYVTGGAVSIDVPGGPQRFLNEHGYLHRAVKAGAFLIKASIERPAVTSSLDLTCEDGALVFVDVRVKWPMFTGLPKMQIHGVDEEAGISAVAERRLVLD